MSEPRQGMSRRAMLRAAGITPAVLLAGVVSEETRAQVSSATSGVVPKNVNGFLYAKVLEHLWTWFLEGAGNVEVEDEVLQRAIKLTWQPITTKLSQFPADGKDITTLVCAWTCGRKAADEAGTGTITADIFESAYNKTKVQMAASLARAKVGPGDSGGLAC